MVFRMYIAKSWKKRDGSDAGYLELLLSAEEEAFYLYSFPVDSHCYRQLLERLSE